MLASAISTLTLVHRNSNTVPGFASCQTCKSAVSYFTLSGLKCRTQGGSYTGFIDRKTPGSWKQGVRVGQRTGGDRQPLGHVKILKCH